LTLQGKEVVLESAWYPQSCRRIASKGQDVMGLTRDPFTIRLLSYRGLAVSKLKPFEEGSVDQREFDFAHGTIY